jgi:WD40 repeat protein/tRNA A-37 threonylcarbamoyl transferase component Bud32
MSEPSIQELFNRIVALPPEEREKALRLLDVEHPAHAARIRRLLPFHQPLAEEPTLSSPDDLGTEADAYVGDEDHSRDLPEIPGFQIVEPLDHGGQSTVYLATQSNPRRRVAIKVMRSSILDARAQARFLAEAEVQGTIRHPAIVGVHACGVHDAKGRPLSWIAMELVPGARDIIKAARADRWDRRRRIEAIATVADAIHAAHLRGVIHRDVKPGNVLVGQDGQARIIDFGIARVIDSTEAFARTREGEVLGTLKYIAPEQLDGSGVDARADVYALGILAFELLHDRSPYGNLRSFAAFYAAIQRHEIEQPRARTRADRDLNAVLGKAFARLPGDRYESMAAFARDLRSLAASNRVDARPRGAIDELRRLAARHPLPALLSLLLAVAVMIGIGTSVWLLDRADAEQDRRTLWLASVAIQQGDYELAARRLAEVEAPKWMPTFGRADLSFPIGLLRSQLVPRHLENHPKLVSFGNRYEAALASGSARQILLACGGRNLTLVQLPDVEIVRDLLLKRPDTLPPMGELIRMSVDSTPSNRLTFATIDTCGDAMIFDADRSDLLDGDLDTLTAFDMIESPSSDAEKSAARLRGVLVTDRVLALGDTGGRVIVRPFVRADDESGRVERLGDATEIQTGLQGVVTAIASTPGVPYWIVGTTAGDVALMLAQPLRHPTFGAIPLSICRRLSHLDDSVDRVALSPDGRYVVASDGRHVIALTIESSATATSKQFGLEESGNVWGLSFSPNSDRLAITGRSGQVRLVDTADWRTTATIDETAGVTWSTAWHFEDLYITTERSSNSPEPVPEGIMRLRDATRARIDTLPERRFGGHGDAHAELVLNENEWFIEDARGRQTLDFSGLDASVYPGDIECVSIRSRADRTDDDSVVGVIISRNAGLLTFDGRGVVHAGPTKDEITDHNEPIREVRLSPDGSHVLWRSQLTDIRGLSLTTPGAGPMRIPVKERDPKEAPETSSESDERVRTMGIHDWSDGKHKSLAVGTVDGRILRVDAVDDDFLLTAVWDPRRLNWEEPLAIPGWIVAFTHDPATDTSYAGSQNGLVSKWRSEIRVPDWGIGRRRSMIQDLALHPEGRYLVTLDSRGFIEVLDTVDGEPMVMLGPLPGTPESISIDGGVVTAHASDGRALRWGEHEENTASSRR